MAQLVEHHLAKVGVAGSSPVVRSRTSKAPPKRGAFFAHRKLSLYISGGKGYEPRVRRSIAALGGCELTLAGTGFRRRLAGEDRESLA